MVDILRIWKAAPVNSWSYFSEIVDGAGMGRWRAGVFNTETAFGTDLI